MPMQDMLYYTVNVTSKDLPNSTAFVSTRFETYMQLLFHLAQYTTLRDVMHKLSKPVEQL
jgi:hypothetical protein